MSIFNKKRENFHFNNIEESTNKAKTDETESADLDGIGNSDKETIIDSTEVEIDKTRINAAIEELKSSGEGCEELLGEFKELVEKMKKFQ